jgi:hypothetical protein
MSLQKALKVRDLRKDKQAIDAELRRFSTAGQRRPRLEFQGPDCARIVDEWGVVSNDDWAGWVLRFN